MTLLKKYSDKYCEKVMTEFMNAMVSAMERRIPCKATNQNKGTLISLAIKKVPLFFLLHFLLKG